MRKSAKVTIYALVSLCVVLVAGLALGANYMFAYALDSRFEEGSLSEEEDDETTEQLAAADWLVSSSRLDSIISHDGLELAGYYLPAAEHTDKYALLVHGYKAEPTGMAEHALHYHRQGWNVLVPHHRAHGDSEGRYIGMGWLEHYDMLGWLAHILAMNPSARIAVHGVSMGAATTMLTTGSANLPPNVLVAVEDCGYTTVTEEFAHQLKAIFGLPSFPLLPATSVVTRIKADYSFADVDCVAAVARSDTPTLFIHGDKDDFVPFWMLDVLYDAAACPKEKLVVPNAAHAEARQSNPELYWTTVDNWLARYVE